MTPDFAAPPPDGPVAPDTTSEAAWVLDPGGAFRVDLRTGVRRGDAALPPGGDVDRMLIPGLDVPLVLDPSRRVFVPLDPPPPREPTDP